MSVLSRREFLSSAAALAVASGMPAQAAMGPNDKFDLVIKGGTSSIPVKICAADATSVSALG